MQYVGPLVDGRQRMALFRYVLYFFGIAIFTWLLTLLEIASPGTLQPQAYASPGEIIASNTYSPIEIVQPGMLVICGLLYAWVAKNCPSQRPIAFLFGGMALAFTIRELDFFFHRHIADNFWQVLVGLIAALVIAYTYRNRRRFRIAWLRMWPSPGLTLLFAGAIIMFVFVRLVGHEPLWMAILGDGYQRIMKLAVEDFIELMGYFLWLIGTIEYTYQARAIAFKEPQPAAARRRAKRIPKSDGRF